MIGRLNAYLFWTRIICNLLPFFAFFVAYVARFAGYFQYWSSDYEPHLYFALLVLTTIVWAVVTDHYRLVGSDAVLEERTGFRRVFLAFVTTYTILFAFLFFYRFQTFSRVFLTVSAAVLFCSAVVLRIFVRWLVRSTTASSDPVRLLVVGADDYAIDVARRLTAIPNPACRIAGYVRVEGQKAGDADAPVFTPDQLDEIAVGGIADDVIVALAPPHWHSLGDLMPQLDRIGAPVRVALDFGNGIAVRDRLLTIGAVNLADLTPTPADTVYYLLFKRAVDILIAGIALIFLWPLMLVIAAAVKLSSRGPVMFVQERVGLNGKLFRMYKIRTMYVAPKGETDQTWTRAGDARCTRIGAFLRRTSLDELPQFFNVLRGDMSVVGPRPERPHFVRQFLHDIARYNGRHRLKVGITGWAQVNGLRGDTSIDERVRYDLYYLQNWSLVLDLRIMLMTVWAGVAGKNAY